MVAAVLLAFACRNEEPRHSQIIVRNPEYLVVRSIRRAGDAEHINRVQLPYSGARYGFASTSVLLDLTAFDPAGATFAGGRTSVVGEATIWLPLTAAGSRRLEDWSAEHQGDYLGIFLKGQLVAAPRIESRVGGGIPLRVPNKREGDVILKELRAGGITR